MYSNERISSIAIQLNIIIKDYDVCILVAKLYIKLRIRKGLEETLNYHTAREISYWKGNIYHGLDLPALHERKPSYHFIREDRLLFKSIIRYMANKNGGVRHTQYWRIWGSAMGISGLDKGHLTIRDKANDLKSLKIHLIRSHAFLNGSWNNSP